VFVVVLLSVARAGIGVMLVAVAALALGQIFLSDKIGLFAMGAKETSPEEAPGLHSMIERLCIQADLPKPRVAVADTAMPNAFAMGRTPKNAVVCCTTGIMNTLEPHELEAVLAHELTHVKNRDVLVMTIASFFAMIAAMITQFGFFFGGGFGGDDGDSEGGGFVLVLLVSFAVYILSFFLMLSLSRYREFAADRGSALITGRPSALISALLKISGRMQQVPTQDLRAAGQMSAFFIIPPSVKSAAATIFSDHPPIEKRIDQLQRSEAQMAAGAAS
jgi:heat shock protein HtpX